ncbi:hypothetical protein [Sphingobacterium mizutaii]|uniref:hypothetical protein n=1 Tax=Sphingobacterium mizutaii TaxID=1010 RepID=UPI003D98C11A
MFTNSIIRKLTYFLFFLLSGLMLFSCSKEDEDIGGSTLIKQYGLTGQYRFQVIPTMMGTIPIATGTVDGTVSDEGNGVLRLRFNGFRANPMPFEMSVDASFTISETAKGLLVQNVEGKSFFDADPPAGGADPDVDPGFEIPEEALKKGLHSNGKSKLTGTIDKNPNGSGAMQYDLKLDPAVSLPVVVIIKSVQKLN